jgi:hypothetical protein
MNVLSPMRDWYERHIAGPAREQQQNKADQTRARRKAPVVRTPVTEDEAKALGQLAGVVYRSGRITSDSRVTCTRRRN